MHYNTKRSSKKRTFNAENLNDRLIKRFKTSFQYESFLQVNTNGN